MKNQFYFWLKSHHFDGEGRQGAPSEVSCPGVAAAANVQVPGAFGSGTQVKAATVEVHDWMWRFSVGMLRTVARHRWHTRSPLRSSSFSALSQVKLPEVETVRTTQSTGKKNGDVKESLVPVKSVDEGLSDSGWA